MGGGKGQNMFLMILFKNVGDTNCPAPSTSQSAPQANKAYLYGGGGGGGGGGGVVGTK